MAINNLNNQKGLACGGYLPLGNALLDINYYFYRYVISPAISYYRIAITAGTNIFRRTKS